MRIHENLGPICYSMDSGGSGWGQVCDFSGRSLLIIIPGRMAGAVEALEIRSYEKQQKDRGCSSWRKETLAGVGGKGDDCEGMVCPSWRACRSTLGPMSTFPKRKRSRFIVPAHLSEKRASRGLYQNVKDLGLGMEQGGWSRWRCERRCLEGNQGVKSDGPKEASVRMTEI